MVYNPELSGECAKDNSRRFLNSLDRINRTPENVYIFMSIH